MPVLLDSSSVPSSWQIVQAPANNVALQKLAKSPLRFSGGSMSKSLFKRPDRDSLTLWSLFCLLPSLAFAILMRDVWFEPRSVLTGAVASKSFRAESHGYGSMHFMLREQPYDFSALLKIVALPERPGSSYGELAEGSTASVTVFTRDLAVSAAPGRVVPVLRIDQSGRSIYVAGQLFYGWIVGPILIIATLGGLVGTAIRNDVLAASRAGRLLALLDRPAQRLAQIVSPVREFSSVERQARHDRTLAVGRFGTLIVVCMLAMAVSLLVRAVL